MPTSQFQALVVEKSAEKTFSSSIQTRTISDLPQGDVVVRVHYSSLNYKDALSASGNPAVTRSFPHTPGIDAAGVVESSDSAEFSPGDQVIVHGYDLGMNTSGGYGQYIRVPAGWVVALPDALSLREAMIYGTAGFTSAECVAKIVDHGIMPDAGEVLVTGATGGVGSVAVAMLAKLGYNVVAVTGKADKHAWLKTLGATTVVGREDVTDASRPLHRPRWAAVVDTVGGDMLATALATTRYNGAVTACGLVASASLKTTVLPFILRGVTLYGIDSVECDINFRKRIWSRLASDLHIESLESLINEIALAQLPNEIAKILKGQQVGRVVVNLLTP